MRRALVLLLLLPGIAHAEKLLHAGPMHAWTELRSTAIWVQTARLAAIQLRYFPAAAPATARLTPVVATAAAQEHIATFLLPGLEPATEYRYKLYIDGALVERPYPLAFATQPLWQWRQPAPDFEVMFGSCLYVNEGPYDRPGTPFGSEHEILAAMAARYRHDLMLWLGDNLYTREADDYSSGGSLSRRAASTARCAGSGRSPATSCRSRPRAGARTPTTRRREPGLARPASSCSTRGRGVAGVMSAQSL